MRLFVDLDGVLADFDGAYARHFGVELNRNGEEPPDLWRNIRTQPRFFADLPLLRGALEMWRAFEPYSPTILSGANTEKFTAIIDQKREWVVKHLGAHVPLICCRSREKRKHGGPGDVLVDDWLKYRSLWLEMGGIFVLHTSAEESIAIVQRVMGGSDVRQRHFR